MKLSGKLEELTREICTKHSVALYDINLIKAQFGVVVCVYITRINGVNISDCTKVSKELKIAIDLNELFKEPYTLEVSSPGIERVLKLKKHYASSINENVEITCNLEDIRIKDDNVVTTKKIVGVLKEVSQDYITIDTNDELQHIPFANIKKAKTIYKQ